MQPNPSANFDRFGKADYDKRLMMAPADTPRWYDGEPKRAPAAMFRTGDARTSLWLICCVVADPRVQVDYQ